MSDEMNNPAEAVSGDVASASSEGEANGVDSANESVSLKDLINDATGRKYETDADALKGVKETFQFVGKAGQSRADNIQKASDSGDLATLRSEMEALRQDNWFSRHPEYESVKDAILEMRKPGEDFDKVVSKEAFKKLYEPAKEFNEIQKSKSALVSSSRLGVVKDKMAEAKQKAEAGDYEGGKASAIGAVLDAYDMK